MVQYITWAWASSKREFSFSTHLADLDGDGAVEWIISIARLTKCEWTSYSSCVFRSAYIFEYKNAQFVIKHLIRTTIEELSTLEFVTIEELSTSPFVTIEELNDDGQIELVWSTRECEPRGSPHTCFTDLHVGQWDGQQLHSLGSMSQASSEISILDQDGDGNKEIVMHGGLIRLNTVGMQREHTQIYGWKEGRYQLVARTPDFLPDNIYFLMLDAHAALMNEEWDKALELAMMVVTQPNLQPKMNKPFSDWERSRIVSYAAILAMLVHTQHGEVGAMEALLREVETRYDQFENPYVEAAQRLWYTYHNTQDPQLACQAVEGTVREHQGLAAFVHAAEYLPTRSICPFD